MNAGGMLSYRGARIGPIEASIAQAEETLASRRDALNDPTIVSDATRLAAILRKRKNSWTSFMQGGPELEEKQS